MCKLVTQPADHEKSTWVSTWTEEQLGRDELEQATLRDVRRDEQSQRESPVKQGQALDNEKKVKERTYSWQ